MSDSNDKLYIIVIIGMIFFFIYWYQTRLDTNKIDPNVCKKCIKTSKSSKHGMKKSSRSSALKSSSQNNNKHNVKYHNKQNDKHEGKMKKNVRFKSEDKNDDISLDSLETSDKVDNNTTKDDDDDENSTNISIKM